MHATCQACFRIRSQLGCSASTRVPVLCACAPCIRVSAYSCPSVLQPAVTSSVMGAGASHELLAELHDQQQRGLVNVEDRPLNDRGVELLGGILRDARGVRRLRVGGCGLSGAGLQRMVDALCISSEPCRLRRLDLVSVWAGTSGRGRMHLCVCCVCRQPVVACRRATRLVTLEPGP